MTRRWAALGLWLVGAASQGCAGSAGAPASAPRAVAPATTAGTGVLTVTLTHLRSAEGQVLVAVFRQPDGFPERKQAAWGHQRATIADGAAQVRFDSVPAGDLAVAVHHDENNDLVMQTGVFGMPLEGYGFSRDAQGTFGPPSFADAAVHLGAREERQVSITMRY